jgi:hypothetical protein
MDVSAAGKQRSKTDHADENPVLLCQHAISGLPRTHRRKTGAFLKQQKTFGYQKP